MPLLCHKFYVLIPKQLLRCFPALAGLHRTAFSPLRYEKAAAGES